MCAEISDGTSVMTLITWTRKSRKFSWNQSLKTTDLATRPDPIQNFYIESREHFVNEFFSAPRIFPTLQENSNKAMIHLYNLAYSLYFGK